MKKVILIPDSFKGTLSAKEVRGIMRRRILQRWPDCEICEVPLSDGGEGFVEAFLQASGGGTVENFEVQGPLGVPVSAGVGFAAQTAFVEMASCAGLTLVDASPALKTTTYGVGQLIKAALDKNCRRILVGLGGSATTDGGCGMAAALGVKFYDETGRDFVPVGGTLNRIVHIDASSMDKRLRSVEIAGICDVRNPLYGENGSAYVFAPQKGADAQQVEILDAGLRHLAGIVKRDLGLDMADAPGAGAAGGLGYGLLCFTRPFPIRTSAGMSSPVSLPPSLKNGIETLLDLANFDEMLQNADCVFTGEGRLDRQSLMGKAVGGIARRCSKAGVRLVAVVGKVEDAAVSELKAAGISDIILLRDFSPERH